MLIFASNRNDGEKHAGNCDFRAAGSSREATSRTASQAPSAGLFRSLGWAVCVLDGLESDAFDDLEPTYIIAVSDSGRVAGCARLLPAIGPTMVAEVFSSLLPDGRLKAHPQMIESSRFCVETALAEGRAGGLVHEATLTMFAGITEWCMANGYTEIVTVTDLRFERILARVGWPLQR